MENEELQKLCSEHSNLLYYSDESADILKAFNDVIHGLYHIGGEHDYITHTLNTSTYVQEEYKRLLSSIIPSQDLTDIANNLEMIRNLLFGDCFNWDNIYTELRKKPKED